MKPCELVLLHAVGKAKQAKTSREIRWVLAADTIVVSHGKILGKPKSRKHAHQMLSKLQGKWHDVYTGLVLADRKREVVFQVAVKTKVLMKKMDRKEIRNYFLCVDPMDKAGSYGIQEKPGIIHKTKGSYSNVVGLPKEALKTLLRRAGYGQG